MKEPSRDFPSGLGIDPGDIMPPPVPVLNMFKVEGLGFGVEGLGLGTPTLPVRARFAGVAARTSP